MDRQQDAWLTIDEVAARLNVSYWTVYRLLSRCYVVPMIGNHRLSKLQPPAVRTFLNRVKTICQCCAQGKDVARVAAGQTARCAQGSPASAVSRTRQTGRSVTCTE
jgi:excisionase family DNA binding protein